MTQKTDYISFTSVNSLHHLFLERVKRSPENTAYRYFALDKQWHNINWREMHDFVSQWTTALQHEGLKKGDRIGIMLPNCPEWVMCEQAAFNLGLVTVPLYIVDRADNIAYIVKHANIKLLVFDTQDQLNISEQEIDIISTVKHIVCLKKIDKPDPKYIHIQDWLSNTSTQLPDPSINDVHSLATIVYTSGTTGRPKGVMLSHYNILWNAYASAQMESFYPEDVLLSFLPLSHMFERTVGYILPILCGATVAYARSIPLLGEDLQTIRPTILVTVPRIFERVYNKIQTGLEKKPTIAAWLFNLAVDVGWQRFQHSQNKSAWQAKQLLWPLLNKLVATKIIDKLGGNLRFAISGGAPLSFKIAKTFIGLGLVISQGYGMTEASPVVSSNEIDDNEPDSVGQPLVDVDVRLGELNELLVKSPGVMLGYWDDTEATKNCIDSEGWLHTGDQAKIIGRHIYITGRLKEILVLSNGEKVPPADIELAIATDALFDQVLIVGEARPFLSALLVLNSESWEQIAKQFNCDANNPDSLQKPDINKYILQQIQHCLYKFPGYTEIYRILLILTPWTVEDGLMTPTLKLKRMNIINKYHVEIDAMYEGH